MSTRRVSGIDASTIVDQETVVVAPGGPEAMAAPRSAEAPSVRVFEIIRTNQRDPYDVAGPELLEARAARVRAAGDVFDGTHRAAAKVKIVRARVEEFADLGALLASLPSQARMVRQNISQAESSDRVPDERRNVRVHAYLWAAELQADNDYHLILGRTGRKPTRFMNVEISGLPRTRTRDTPRLREVRKTFEDVVRNTRLGLPGTGGYDFYKPPFPVIVEGSLFFDAGHVGDNIGPEDARAKTAWEIHPISSLEFVDDGQEHDSFRDLREATILDMAEFPGTPRRMVVRTTQGDPYDEDER